MDDPNNRTNIPMGLDFNDFMPGIQSSVNSNAPSNPNRPKVPESKDPEVIQNILKNAPNFKLLMSTRKTNLQKVSDTWDNATNKTETFEYLNESKDLGIVNDVVNFIFNKTPIKFMDLRSKEVVVIFPSIINLIKSKYDMYFKNGINAAWKILNYLGNVIINAKQKQILNGGNIEISLEDKIRVYDQIIERFHEILELDNVKLHFDGKPIDDLQIDKFASEVIQFLKKCRGG